MMASRGMGAIRSSKMPKAKTESRRDDTDFTEYAKGGEVWSKPRPESLGAPKKMSSKQKSKAKASAKRAGRPYPNLVDNMRIAGGE
jgi:hypothetical protein